MENAEKALEDDFKRQRRSEERDVKAHFAGQSREVWTGEMKLEKHLTSEERRRRWRLARSRSADEKIARPAPAASETKTGRGGRRASHRVGRAGGGSKKASSSDDGGGGEPPPPSLGIEQGAANPLLTIADLAARWSVACQTIKNRLVKGTDLPPAIRLPCARGPRWRIADVEFFESRAALYKEPAPKPRGRPRISRGAVS